MTDSAVGEVDGAPAAGPAVAGDGVARDDAGQLRAFDLPPELEPERPPLVGRDGRIRLSFSRVDTYRRCPAQFRFAYVERLPGVPAPALSFGSSIHSALEAFYDRKLPRCPTEEELLGFLYDAWDSSGFRELERDEQLAYYRHAQQVLRRFHRRVGDDYHLPVATEAWFELPVGDEVLLVGSIDRVDIDDEGRLTVVDYKTSKRVRDRERVARSLQLAFYALACQHLYGRLPAAVALDFVVAGLEVRVPVEDIDLDGARRVILDTAAAIRDQRYEPEPNRLCGWCDYRAVCPAWEGEGPDVLGAATVELSDLQRSIRRDVTRLRALESGIERLRAAMPGHAGDPD